MKKEEIKMDELILCFTQQGLNEVPWEIDFWGYSWLKWIFIEEIAKQSKKEQEDVKNV